VRVKPAIARRLPNRDAVAKVARKVQSGPTDPNAEPLLNGVITKAIIDARMNDVKNGQAI
jgi:hypothetical protein